MDLRRKHEAECKRRWYMTAKTIENEIQSFPLEPYLAVLVRFLDAIQYCDTSYSREDGLAMLREVYSKTAQHFARPEQKASLNGISDRQLEVIMRTSVQVTVNCWTKLTPQELTALSIYWVYIVTLDDSNDNPHDVMSSFFGDLVHGKPQRHGFWRAMNHYLTDLLVHYGPFCSFSIIRGTLDYFEGCWIEQYNTHGLRGSFNFPGFLRRLNGLGHVVGGTLFPSREFNDREQRQLEQIASVTAETEPYTTLANDLLSYFKEFGNARDQVNLVRNWAYVEDMSIEDAFERLADETIRTGERLVSLVKDLDPGFRETTLGLIHGYVTWHFCDQRYQMADVYQLASGLDSMDATKFCEYYEATMRVWDFDIDDWAKTGCRQDET